MRTGGLLALVACLVHVAFSQGPGGGYSNPAKDRENNPDCKAVRKADDERNFHTVIRQIFTNGSADSDFELDEDNCVTGVVNLDFPLSTNMVHVAILKRVSQKWDAIVENDLPWSDFINKFNPLFSPINCAIKCNKGEADDNYLFESNTKKCEEIYFDKVGMFARCLPQDFQEGTYQLIFSLESDCESEPLGLIITFEVLAKT